MATKSKMIMHNMKKILDKIFFYVVHFSKKVCDVIVWKDRKLS